MPTLSLSGFLRIVTHPKIFKDPTPMATALTFVEILCAAPNHVEVQPGPRHWHLFLDLCRTGDLRGNNIPDAYFAAMAIERNSTWITADRGFARFNGLRWRHPFDDALPGAGAT